jgi:hypothetical protein
MKNLMAWVLLLNLVMQSFFSEKELVEAAWWTRWR